MCASARKSRKNVPNRRNCWCTFSMHSDAPKPFLAMSCSGFFEWCGERSRQSNLLPYRNRNLPGNWCQSGADQGEPEARRNRDAIRDFPAFEEGAFASEYPEAAPDHHHGQQGQACN